MDQEEKRTESAAEEERARKALEIGDRIEELLNGLGPAEQQSTLCLVLARHTRRSGLDPEVTVGGLRLALAWLPGVRVVRHGSV